MRDQYGDQINIINEKVPGSDQDPSAIHGVTVEFVTGDSSVIMCLTAKQTDKLIRKLSKAADRADLENAADLATAPRGLFGTGGSCLTAMRDRTVTDRAHNGAHHG